LPFIVQTMPFVGRLILENISLLFQAAARIVINRLEPVLELWISVCISVDIVDRLEKVICAR
jgi:frataxin-like iron-binding protein CyaY